MRGLHSRRSRVASSGYEKEIKTWQALTLCRAKCRLISRLKGDQEVQQLTSCRIKGGLDQWAGKGAGGSSNSLSAEPRVGLISWLERVPGIAATHRLQSQE